MIPSSQAESILDRFPKFKDSFIGFEYAPRLPKAMVKETRVA